MFHIGIATQHPPLPNSSEMSEEGIAFIQACVTLDPTARPSAAELIGHPWLAHFQEGAVSGLMLTENSQANEQEFEGEEGAASAESSTLVDSLESQQRYHEKYQQDHFEEAIDEGEEGEEGNEVSLNEE